MPFAVFAHCLHLFHKVINHQPYDQKADVFSFAIVLWELVTAKACPIVTTGLNLNYPSFLSMSERY